jgi:hypothetical protein
MERRHTGGFGLTACCLEGFSNFAPGTGVRSDDLIYTRLRRPRRWPSHPQPFRLANSVDDAGRAIPMTDEEIRARAAEIARGLDALDDMGDEEEQRQTLDALMKAIDEEPLSARKRFRP